MCTTVAPSSLSLYWKMCLPISTEANPYIIVPLWDVLTILHSTAVFIAILKYNSSYNPMMKWCILFNSSLFLLSSGLLTSTYAADDKTETSLLLRRGLANALSNNADAALELEEEESYFWDRELQSYSASYSSSYAYVASEEKEKPTTFDEKVSWPECMDEDLTCDECGRRLLKPKVQSGLWRFYHQILLLWWTIGGSSSHRLRWHRSN